ncbi:hypothetical protein JCM8202v2_000124 [Rhodotorula sphaerocarpa]
MAIDLSAALQRLFLAFGVFAGPQSWFFDAPFGRFGTLKWLSVSGDAGWLVMEIVSPLAFLYALALPITTSGTQAAASFLRPLQPAAVLEAWRALPRARAILTAAFLVHYVNRSVISTLRNPGRARMHIAVPLSAVLFNIANGLTLGMYIGGGFGAEGLHAPSPGSQAIGDGLAREAWARPLFVTGLALWLVGFVSNIYHDEVLYSLKRQRKSSPSDTKKPQDAGADHRQRYSIPPRSKGLYRFVSHPAYSSEWLEWIGFTLATWALGTSPFPSIASTFALAGGGKRLVPLVAELCPLRSWYLQPPVLFVLQEISVMLPRATRGHWWYEKTFGRKEWSEKGQKWVVIPGVW